MALPIGAFLIAWSGVYNVAASSGHWAIVEHFLAFGMRNSVALRARSVVAPQLDDMDLARLGAAHFHAGCAFCHGSPDTPVSPIARQMLPSPPNLATSMRPWTDEQLFWVIQHGIKYTGMPGWVAHERADEVWAVVAFLRKMPHLDGAAYRALALGNVQVDAQSGASLATQDASPQAVGACARCHGAAGNGPVSALVPVLHGQSAEYIGAALRAYANGSRRSGIMQPLAADLSAQDIDALAAYYAGLKREPLTARPATSASAIGQQLAMAGDPVREIPACESCHGRTGLSRYPRLAGQNAPYLMGQLRALAAAHHRALTPSAAIMAPIAQRLTEADIEAAAAYYSRQPPAPVVGGAR